MTYFSLKGNSLTAFIFFCIRCTLFKSQTNSKLLYKYYPYFCLKIFKLAHKLIGFEAIAVFIAFVIAMFSYQKRYCNLQTVLLG
jgi:hypothetical protein